MTRIILFLFPLIMPTVASGKTIAEKMAYISQLQTEISELDSQLSKCRQNTKKWTVAAIAGGVGTVATGIGVAVQANKLNKLKKSGAAEQDTQTAEDTE